MICLFLISFMKFSQIILLQRLCQLCDSNSELKILPIDQQSAQFETEIINQENFGFGIWFQWQSLSNNKKIYEYEDVQSYFLYLAKLQNSESILKLWFEKDSDCESSKLALKMKSDLLMFERKSLFYEIDLEGVWVLFYTFIDIFQNTAAFFLFQSESKELRKIIIKQNVNFQGTLIHIVGGYSNITSNDYISLEQFSGRISTVILGKEIFQNENVENCLKLINTCIQQNSMNLIGQQAFQANHFEQFETYILQKPIYQLRGWFKLDLFQPLQTINVIKIQQMLNDQFEKSELTIIYELKQQNKVRITLCSKSDICEQNCNFEEKLIFFDLLQQWHFLQLNFGIPKNRAILQIYSNFFPFTELMEIFACSYTNQQNILFIGGDDQSPQQLSGIIANLEYQSFCEEQQYQFTPICHYSCQTCFGPLINNCLTCYTSDNHLFYQNSCICKTEALNNQDQPQCSTFQENFSFIKIMEEELLIQQKIHYLDTEGKVLCQYGFFEYNNKCVKCPYFNPEQQSINIFCLDCYLNPRSFYAKPQCSLDAMSYFSDKKNIYEQKQREIYEIQYFKIIEIDTDQYELVINQNVIGIEECKNGYNGCLKCNSNQKCNQCKAGYFMNLSFQCEKCINCLQCELKEDKINCLQCPDKHYLDKEKNQCIKCGLYCASCNENGFCIFCEDLQKYFISLKNGKDCEICSLENCRFCYHQPTSTLSKSMYSQFIPYYKFFEVNFDDIGEVEIMCSRCMSGFTLLHNYESDDPKLQQYCGEYPLHQQDCYFISQLNGYTCLINADMCYFSPYCQLCTDSYRLCFECRPGLYVDYSTFSCVQCPSNCGSCTSYYMDILPYSIIYLQGFLEDYNYYMTTKLPINKQVMCFSCNDGYVLHNDMCIQNCQVGCQECKIINDKSVCIKCHQITVGFEKTLNKNGQCQTCPISCAACIDRDPDEITSINRFFMKNSDNEKYTRFCFYKFDTKTKSIYFLRNQYVVNECKKFKGFQRIITFTWNLFCDENQFKFSNDGQDALRQNYLIQDFFDNEILNLIEIDLFTNYFNDDGFIQIDINLNLIQGNTRQCDYKKGIILKSNLLAKVFYLSDLNLKIYSEKKFLLQNEFLKVSGFSSITFQNLQFQLFKTQVVEDQINQISFVNCDIINYSNNNQQEFSLTFGKINLLNIQNFTIQDVNYSNQFIFICQFDQVIQNINISNLTISNSYFYNSSLIFINIVDENSKVRIKMSDVKVVNSTFSSSNFIYSEGGENILVGNMDFLNFMFSQTKLITSIFFLLPNVERTSISQIIIDNSSLQNRSYFLLSNSFEIYDFKVTNIKMGTSFLISNSINQFYQTNLNGTINITLVQFRIENIQYDSFQSVLQLIKYSNCDNQLYVIGLQIIEASYEFDDSSNHISQVQTLIHIDCLICLFDQIFIERKNGISEISVVNSQKIQITNSIFTQSQKNLAKNLHPSSFDCLQQSQKSHKFFYLYIEQYREIIIDNLQIINAIAHNSPFIIIEGTEKQFSERIEIRNTQFYNNFMTISENNSTSSLIQIKSEKQSYVLILNTTFSENFLNAYAQDLQVVSSTTIFIQLKIGSILVENCSFSNNLITNSTDSILYFKADTITIENSNFYQNNFLNFTKLIKQIVFEENIKEVNVENLEQIFLLYSHGGNGYIQAKNIYFINLYVNQSFSMKGGAFYFVTFGNSNIQIENSVFYKNQASLLNNLNSLGGCFYIDAQFSNLTLIIQNTTFEKSLSRRKGGIFYIIPSDSLNFFSFQNITILNCFSIQSSLLDFTSAGRKTMMAKFELKQISIYQTQQEFDEFLSKLDQFSTIESSYLLNSNPLFYITTGNLTFFSCSLISEVGVFLVQMDEGQQVNFVNLTVKNSVVFSSALIKIDVQQSYPSQIKLSKIFITNLKEFISPETAQICKKSKSSISINFNCRNPDFDIQTKIRLIDNDEEIYKNQLICNQQILYSTKKQNFSLIQITNIENIHTIQAKLIQFESVFCYSCQYGLISLLNIEQNTQTNIEFKEIMFKNSICGLTSCLTIIQDENQNYFQTSLLKQSRRMLQTLNYDQIYQNIQFQVVLFQSHFVSNMAKYGGGMSIIGTNIVIINSKFLNNSAKVGGAIYYVKNNTKFLLIQTQIINNFAQTAGGLFLFDSQLQETEILEVFLSNNNSSISEMDVLEKPRSLTISIDGGNTILQKKTLSNTSDGIVEQITIQPYTVLGYDQKFETLTFPSGQAIGKYSYLNFYEQPNINFNLTFRIIALNQFKQHVTSLDNAQCTLSHQVINLTNKQNLSDSNTKLSYYKINYDLQTNDFNLDNLIINFNPYYSKEIVLKIFIDCDCVQIPIQEKSPPFQTVETINKYQLQLDVRTFPCQLGEYFNTSAKICALCNPSYNQYQVILNATNCLFKDEQKIKSIQSQLIELKSNYWRPYYYSTKIEECFHLPENCLGGWYPGDNSCIYGHIGALCEQCDIYNIRGHGYFASKRSYRCGDCNLIIDNALSISLVCIWTLGSIFMSVSSTITTIKQFLAQKYLVVFGIGYMNRQSSAAVLIKIFTNYSQIIQTISTFQLKVPDSFFLIFNNVGGPIEQMAYSFDCFLITISNIPIIYFRILWSLFMAISFIFIFFILLGAAVLMKKIRFNISMITTSFIYIFIYLQPNIIKYLISLISFRVISEVAWISGNVQYRYDTNEHKVWLSTFCLPLFILVSLIIPGSMFYKLKSQRTKLDLIKARETWGYLYNEYKLKAYYWEFVKIFEKECIIIALSYYEDYITIKAPVVFLFIFAYNYLTTSISPYQTGELNKFDIQSNTICGISILLGSAIYSAQNFNLNELIYPFYSIITLLNAYFILKIIVKIFIAYLNLLHQYTDKIKEVIAIKFQKKLQNCPQITQILESQSKKETRIRANFQKIKQFLITEARKNLQFKKLINSESEQIYQTIPTSIQRFLQQTQTISVSEKIL